MLMQRVPPEGCRAIAAGRGKSRRLGSGSLEVTRLFLRRPVAGKALRRLALRVSGPWIGAVVLPLRCFREVRRRRSAFALPAAKGQLVLLELCVVSEWFHAHFIYKGLLFITVCYRQLVVALRHRLVLKRAVLDLSHHVVKIAIFSSLIC